MPGRSVSFQKLGQGKQEALQKPDDNCGSKQPQQSTKGRAANRPSHRVVGRYYPEDTREEQVERSPLLIVQLTPNTEKEELATLLLLPYQDDFRFISKYQRGPRLPFCRGE